MMPSWDKGYDLPSKYCSLPGLRPPVMFADEGEFDIDRRICELRYSHANTPGRISAYEVICIVYLDALMLKEALNLVLNQRGHAFL